MLVGRPERQHLPPRLAGRGQPVDPGEGVRTEPSGGQRRGVQLDPGGTREVHVIDLMDTPRRDARTEAQRTSAPDQDRKAGASPRWWAVRGQAHRRRHGRRLRRHLPRRPREAPRGGEVQGAGRHDAGWRTSCTPSTPTSTACAGRASSRSRRPGRWQFTFEAWTDRWATYHDELRRKVEANLDEDLSGEISEGLVLLEKALARAKGDAKGSIEYARGVLGLRRADAREVRRRARPGAVRLDGGGLRARGRDDAREAADRSRSTA